MPAEPAALFAALGDPVRLRLLGALGAEGRTISALAEGLPISRQAVAKHLRVLERAGLVAIAREGREARVRADPAAIAAARAHLDRIAADWDAALLRLKLRVEEG